jgi:hypothetical protein
MVMNDLMHLTKTSAQNFRDNKPLFEAILPLEFFESNSEKTLAQLCEKFNIDISGFSFWCLMDFRILITCLEVEKGKPTN